MSQGRWTETKTTDREHSNVDPDEEAARNRNTLLSYFNDIASIPTLTKDSPAPRRAAANRCDLILMDLEMPEMDGLEATRRIRAQEREAGLRPVPILALTAHALQEYRERCLAAGCSGYLSKPIRMQSLLDAVAAALGDRGKPRRPQVTPLAGRYLELRAEDPRVVDLIRCLERRVEYALGAARRVSAAS